MTRSDEEMGYLRDGYFLSLRQMKLRFLILGFSMACYLFGFGSLPFVGFAIPYLILGGGGAVVFVLLFTMFREKSPQEWAEIVKQSENP